MVRITIKYSEHNLELIERLKHLLELDGLSILDTVKGKDNNFIELLLNAELFAQIQKLTLLVNGCFDKDVLSIRTIAPISFAKIVQVDKFRTKRTLS
jgi:hypothetical protein